MRWRLGRSSAKKKAASPVGSVVVAPTNRASTTTTTTGADAGTERQRSDGSPDVHGTSTNEAVGDIFYCATASCCLSHRRRPTNSTCVNGARLWTTDGITSSLVSFVEGLGSQPRHQSFSAEGAHSSPSSTGQPDNGNGAQISCGGGADDNALLLSTVGARADGIVDGSTDRGSNNAVATTVGIATSSISATRRAEITQEDLLIAEVHDYLLRRRGFDHKTAAVASRMCLALTLSWVPMLEAVQEVEPDDLVSLARETLGLSSGACTGLLAHLVDNWTKASDLITAGADLDDSHSQYPLLGGVDRVHSGAVKGVENPIPPDCLLHRVETQPVDRVLSGTETLAAPGAEAAEAVRTLYEACRVWRDIVEAINSTTRGTSGGRRDGPARTRSTATRASSGGVQERAHSSPPGTSWFCSLESPKDPCRKDQCRPHLESNNERSTAADMIPTEIVEGTGESREYGQQDRVR